MRKDMAEETGNKVAAASLDARNGNFICGVVEGQ